MSHSVFKSSISLSHLSISDSVHLVKRLEQTLSSSSSLNVWEGTCRCSICLSALAETTHEWRCTLFFILVTNSLVLILHPELHSSLLRSFEVFPILVEGSDLSDGVPCCQVWVSGTSWPTCCFALKSRKTLWRSFHALGWCECWWRGQLSLLSLPRFNFRWVCKAHGLGDNLPGFKSWVCPSWKPATRD